jgi:C1q domain
MPLDINGFSLSSDAGLVLGASGSKILAANYGIKDPLLPGMHGSATLGGSSYKIYPFPINSANVNIGSPWSTSTYRFTAPVAGIYYTSYSGIVGNGTATQMNGYFSIIVNGAALTYSYKDTISLWELMHVELMIKLAAGDWVSWAMNIAPGADSGNASGGYQANHNASSIWLVG